MISARRAKTTDEQLLAVILATLDPYLNPDLARVAAGDIVVMLRASRFDVVRRAPPADAGVRRGRPRKART